MELKKLSILTLMEVIFFFIIIASLVFVRSETRDFFQKTQELSPQLFSLQEQLKSNNITQEDQIQITELLNKVDSLSNKTLVLNNLAFPLFFIIISLIFQVFYWKVAANTPYKRVILPLIAQMSLLLLTSYFGLNFISYLLLISGQFTDLVYFLIVSMFLVTVTLFNFYYFSTTKSAKKILNFWATGKRFAPKLKYLFKEHTLSLLTQYIVITITTFFLYFFVLNLLNVFFTLLLWLFLISLFTAINIYHYSKDLQTRVVLEFFFNIPVLMLFFLTLIVLSILSYVFIEVDIAITAPIILLVIFSIFANMHRIYIISKIKRIIKD